MNKAAEAARKKLREKIYSRTQARLMIHTAILIAKERPDLDDAKIVDTTMELTDMAVEAGQRANEEARKDTDGR